MKVRSQSGRFHPKSVATVNPELEATLRGIIDDPKAVTAWSPALGPLLGLTPTSLVPIGKDVHLAISAEFPKWKGSPDRTSVDWKTLRTFTECLILPMIKQSFPTAKPYVQGVQILLATPDVWALITDEHRDVTKATIAGLKLAQVGTEIYLGFAGPSPLASSSNFTAGVLLATADKLYASQLEKSDGA